MQNHLNLQVFGGGTALSNVTVLCTWPQWVMHSLHVPVCLMPSHGCSDGVDDTPRRDMGMWLGGVGTLSRAAESAERVSCAGEDVHKATSCCLRKGLLMNRGEVGGTS